MEVCRDVDVLRNSGKNSEKKMSQCSHKSRLENAQPHT